MEDTLVYRKVNGRVVLITISGSLDLSASYSLEKTIRQVVLDEPNANIILNMGQVQTIISATLHIFVTLIKELKSEGKKLVLCDVNEHIQNILKAMDIITAFSIFDTEEEAVDALK